ncbi:hypothetical protein [Brucella pituitosa]|uniref:hypothetical protein n=1 Tax=Brucella pituitosa TaxID=571256 RepID=UPI0009A1A28F|nr:hypothetical protein [Brucella pituitosa]
MILTDTVAEDDKHSIVAGAGRQPVQQPFPTFRASEFALAHQRRIRIVDYLGDLDGFGDAEFDRDFHMLVTQTAIKLFSDAQDSGVLRPGDPSILSSFVRGSIRHFVKRLSSNPQPVTEDVLEMLTDMCWRAIASHDDEQKTRL